MYALEWLVGRTN